MWFQTVKLFSKVTALLVVLSPNNQGKTFKVDADEVLWSCQSWTQLEAYINLHLN